MHKTTKSKKSREIIESPRLNEAGDSLGSLLASSEKLKASLYQQKTKSPTLSLTVEVIICVNNVLSEYGEESIKRQRYKNDPNESKPIEGCNNKWTKCVKVLEELITSGRDLDIELSELILLLIAQVHERQSLRIIDKTILNEVIIKWIAHIDCVFHTLTQLYMRCLASFILGNLTDIPKETFASLSGTFFRASERHISIPEPDINTLETLKYCISGLTNLCYLIPSSDGSEIDDFLAKRFQTCGRFFNLFVICLEKLPSFLELPQVSMFRMQHQCLHGLNYVSQRPHGLSLDNTERLLTVLRIYCGFGMFRTSLENCVVVTTDNGDNVLSRNESADNHNNDVLTLGNSAEHYDSDDVAQCAFRPMRKWEIKTRRLAMELLQKVLAKSWRKMASIVWAYFMPSTAWGTRRRFNLLNVLERERDASQKVFVLKAIQQCIVNCRDLLASAQHQPAPSTFVSRSHSLASVIDEIHQRLLATLVADRNTDQCAQIKVATLQCLLVLIRGVPYHRLRPTIVHNVVKGLRQVFLESNHNQTMLRCAILDCFTSLVSFESVSDEMRQLLLRPTIKNLVLTDKDSHHINNQPSWLVQLCVRLAHPSLVAKLWTSPLSSESWDGDMDPVVSKVVSEGALETDAAVRCQALMTVGAMLSQHATLIRPSLDTLKKTLLACLNESLLQDEITNATLRSHVLRVFSGFLSTLENKKVKRYLGIVQDSDSKTNDFFETQINSLVPSDNNEELSMDWWSSFLDSVVMCLKDSDDGVRASATQCMSMMSESILERLVTMERRDEYSKVLLAMFKDTNVAVCCQAVWALGYWVAMRPLNVNLDFIKQLVDACYNLSFAAIEDSSVYVVAANATWSLSNVMEVLVAHKDCLLSCCKVDGQHLSCRILVQHYLSDFTSIERLMKLFCDLCGLKKAGQMSASARIHENAIRGLGYMCRFIDDELASRDTISQQLLVASDVFCSAILLADKAGRVKVKWNACLSASHVFRNPTLTRDILSFNLGTLVETLLSTVASDRYFKVRNNALISLITLAEECGRSSLGPDILKRLVIPLSLACVSVSQKSMVPFSEVHRHCLCLYLIKLLLLKLLSVMSLADIELFQTLEDTSALSTTFTVHMPLIWQHLHHLNRSFNKHTLLIPTLMNPLSVSATSLEVNVLLRSLKHSLDNVWSSFDNKSVKILFSKLLESMSSAKGSCDSLEDMSAFLPSTAIVDSHLSDDEGLLTKRSGASLIFSQIYD